MTHDIFQHIIWHMAWHTVTKHDTWHNIPSQKHYIWHMTYCLTILYMAHDMTYHHTTWHMTHDMTYHHITWHMTHDMTYHHRTWHMTHDILQHDIWHMTWHINTKHDIWHMTYWIYDTWYDIHDSQTSLILWQLLQILKLNCSPSSSPSCIIQSVLFLQNSENSPNLDSYWKNNGILLLNTPNFRERVCKSAEKVR